MTENEAIETLIIHRIFSNGSVGSVDELRKIIDEWLLYHKLGTVDECKEATEKQKAKKPIRNDLCTCPECGTHNEIIKKRRNTVDYDIVYCWHCGQAIEVSTDEGRC